MKQLPMLHVLHALRVQTLNTEIMSIADQSCCLLLPGLYTIPTAGVPTGCAANGLPHSQPARGRGLSATCLTPVLWTNSSLKSVDAVVLMVFTKQICMCARS